MILNTMMMESLEMILSTLRKRWTMSTGMLIVKYNMVQNQNWTSTILLSSAGRSNLSKSCAWKYNGRPCHLRSEFIEVLFWFSFRDLSITSCVSHLLFLFFSRFFKMVNFCWCSSCRCRHASHAAELTYIWIFYLNHAWLLAFIECLQCLHAHLSVYFDLHQQSFEDISANHIKCFWYFC